MGGSHLMIPVDGTSRVQWQLGRIHQGCTIASAWPQDHIRGHRGHRGHRRQQRP